MIDFFGGKLPFTTLVISLIELVIFLIQLGLCLSRPNDISRYRFLFLIAIFIAYNLTSAYIPNNVDHIDNLAQGGLAFFRGVILGAAYLYYLITEIGIQQSKLYSVRSLLIALLLTFVFGYLLTYFMFDDDTIAVAIIKVAPISISLYFCYTTIKLVLEKRREHSDALAPYRAMTLAGYIGIAFIATMPVAVLFGDLKLYNIILVNCGFFLVAYAYLIHFNYQLKLENELLKKVGYFDRKTSLHEMTKESANLADYDLTSRELEIAYLMLQDLNYKNIAEEMFIAPKTVSKHASNIFKKTNCLNREDFSIKFAKH